MIPALTHEPQAYSPSFQEGLSSGSLSCSMHSTCAQGIELGTFGAERGEG